MKPLSEIEFQITLHLMDLNLNLNKKALSGVGFEPTLYFTTQKHLRVDLVACSYRNQPKPLGKDWSILESSILDHLYRVSVTQHMKVLTSLHQWVT